MCVVHRVWTALLLILSAAVGAGVVYVLARHDTVPNAGRALGYSVAPAQPSSSGASDPSTGTQQSSPGRVRTVFLGDDYTAGVGGSPAKARWTTQIAQALDLDATVVAEIGAGYAKSGNDGTTYQKLVDKVAAATPDLVVVTGGRNDVSDADGTLRTGARAVFASLHDRLPGATIVAVAPFWGDSPHPAKLTKVDAAVKTGVEAIDGTYLDVRDPLTGHPGWMSDVANPNDRGYAAIAAALTAALRGHVPH
jgi:acyl-CoA thioesterase-1